MKGIAATVGPGGRRDFFWLERNFEMMASSPARGLGFNLRFGGIFTSVPAAAAAMARRPLVVSGGTLTTEAVVGQTLGPVVTGQELLTHRLDLFGLGRDYALYHKRFWGVFDQDDLSPWRSLGGVLTSAPAAIARGSRVDVFGVGMDHALYTKTITGESWTPHWQRLGGTFTSAASVISRGPGRLDLFARGADFTLQGNQTDGNSWFGWQNHGGSLASPPVAVSWGPDRIDVFATFQDGVLWHRWWDGQIWNEWESLGGNYRGEPAAASWGPGRVDVFVVGAADGALHHHWFSDDTWQGPETMNIGSSDRVIEPATVISGSSNRLEVFVPTSRRQIRIGKWDGKAWEFGAAGASIRIPSRYRFSVDHVRVRTTRAFNADTDGAMAAVAIGNSAAMTKTQWIGKIGGLQNPKTAQTNLLDFEPVTVDLAEPMSFTYLVVNNGNAGEDEVLAGLAKEGDSLSAQAWSSMQEDIGKGIPKIASVKVRAAVPLTLPVAGNIISDIGSWLADRLFDIVGLCDGVVAVELRAMMGRDVFLLTDNGRKTFAVTTTHPGTDTPAACGFNSEYEVTWSIKPL